MGVLNLLSILAFLLIGRVHVGLLLDWLRFWAVVCYRVGLMVVWLTRGGMAITGDAAGVVDMGVVVAVVARPFTFRVTMRVVRAAMTMFVMAKGSVGIGWLH